jgi:signal transduction histidine kinase
VVLVVAVGWIWQLTRERGGVPLPAVAAVGVFAAGTLLSVAYMATVVRQSRERQQLIEQLQATRAELAAAERQAGTLAERQRLARDLHDTIAQTLANGAASAEVASRHAARNAKASGELKRLRRMLVEAQEDLRDILFNLRPVVLETGGLAEAAKALAQRLDGTSGVRVAPGRTEARTRLRPEVEAGAFQIMREAANNAIKHGAKRVTLDAYEDDQETILRVEDDGAGFDVPSVIQRYPETGSLGLLQIRESARAIGAQLMLDSSPGRGTRVIVGIPHELNGAATA